LAVPGNCTETTWYKWWSYFKFLWQTLVSLIWALFTGNTLMPTSGFIVSYISPSLPWLWVLICRSWFLQWIHLGEYLVSQLRALLWCYLGSSLGWRQACHLKTRSRWKKVVTPKIFHSFKISKFDLFMLFCVHSNIGKIIFLVKLK